MSDFQSNRPLTPSNTQYLYSGPYFRYSLLPPVAMPREQTRTLWCLVEHDPAPFEVTLRDDAKVTHLKDAIKERRHDVDASTLLLWQVGLYPRVPAFLSQLTLPHKLTEPELVEPEASLPHRIRSKGDMETFATRMTATQKLLTLFPQHPPEDHLHVLIKVLPTKSSAHTLSRTSVDDETTRPRPFVSPHWSSRKDTVRSLYDVLLEERFVQVRGTPGCGKTTLMNLLHAYILEKDPEALVYTRLSWPLETLQSDEALNLRLRQVDPAYPRRKGQVFLLFDQGQETYEDTLLWNTFLKGVGDCLFFAYRVILFCSYGSPSSRPISHRIGTALVLRDAARISMWPTERSIGILLSRSEFDEVVSRFYRPLNLHPDLSDLIFGWTVGHVGAIVELLRLVPYQRVSDNQERNQFTVVNFLEENPTHTLFGKLSGGAFARGLPLARELSEQPDVAVLFRKLLQDGEVGGRELENDAIDRCNRNGWIYPNPTTGDQTIVRYTLPSPLHAMCLSWRFEPTNDMPKFASILKLSLEVISKFKPSQLHLPIRRAGVPTQDSLPEAQYQDEFYRSVFTASSGNVRISPEFASAKRAQVAGRIDFFIPAAKWGIEITRDGSLLEQHSSRFANSGAYGAWLQSSDMLDYILLDFRMTIPRKAHPDIPKLFHVVFGEKYREFSLYDNQLGVVAGPILLENH